MAIICEQFYGGVMKQIANFGGSSSTSTAKEVLSKVKTSRESVTSSTTLQDDNDFSFSLKSNTTYAINATNIVSAPSTGGIKWAFTVPSGASGRINAKGLSNVTTDTDITVGAGSNNSVNVNGSDADIRLIGYITTTNAGTLTFQWSQHTSNATATYIERGSTMILTEV